MSDAIHETIRVFRELEERNIDLTIKVSAEELVQISEFLLKLRSAVKNG